MFGLLDESVIGPRDKRERPTRSEDCSGAPLGVAALEEVEDEDDAGGGGGTASFVTDLSDVVDDGGDTERVGGDSVEVEPLRLIFLSVGCTVS